MLYYFCLWEYYIYKVQKERKNKMTTRLNEARKFKEKNIYDLKNLLFYAVVTNDSEMEKQVKNEIKHRLTV